MSAIGEIDFTSIMGYIISPVTGVVAWLAGRRARNNDFLQQLQDSIDMLTRKNNELLVELVTVKEQNAQLKVTMSELKIDNESLRTQVQNLTHQLENVRTITKIEKRNA